MLHVFWNSVHDDPARSSKVADCGTNQKHMWDLQVAVIRASCVALLSCPTICSLLLLLLYILGKMSEWMNEWMSEWSWSYLAPFQRY